MEIPTCDPLEYLMDYSILIVVISMENPLLYKEVQRVYIQSVSVSYSCELHELDYNTSRTFTVVKSKSRDYDSFRVTSSSS